MDPQADCPVGELDRAVGIELAHQIQAMGLYRLDGNLQALGDVAVAAAFGNKLQNLAFSYRQAYLTVQQFICFDYVLDFVFLDAVSYTHHTLPTKG